MEFKDMLRSRILEILNAWPVRDQYAIMFFLYPNECFTYGEYENLPEFDLLYRCESEIQPDGGSAFGATEALESSVLGRRRTPVRDLLRRGKPHRRRAHRLV